MAIFSGFIPNTPVVAMMVKFFINSFHYIQIFVPENCYVQIPVIQGWSRRNNLMQTQLLMPLSFASILGGTCTLIGTSTNLVVYGLAQKEIENFSLNFFEIALVGLPNLICGLIYILIFSRCLLPKRKSEDEIERASGDDRYVVSVKIVESSNLIGKELNSTALHYIGGLTLLMLEKCHVKLSRPSGETVLGGGDVLRYIGSPSKMEDLLRSGDVVLEEERHFPKIWKDGEERVFEAVLSPVSKMVGNTVKEVAFREHYNAVIFAIYRPKIDYCGSIGEVKLEGGDLLLLRSTEKFSERTKNDRNFVVVKESNLEFPAKNKFKMILSLFILAGLVASTSSGLTSLLAATLVSAISLLLTGCLTPSQAWKSLRGDVMLLIACAFAVGYEFFFHSLKHEITLHLKWTVSLWTKPELQKQLRKRLSNYLSQ